MRGILFDLDGTLLALDLDAFLRRYFEALSGAVAHRAADGAFMAALTTATDAMMTEHPGRTNEVVFWERFEALTGVPAADWRPDIERFYREEFAELRGDAHPAPGGRRAIEAARALGLRVAIATNPIFPRVAIEARMAWAGLADCPVDVVTTYEVMEACKPHPAYFEQTARMLGVQPTDCMMAGDDARLDLAAARTGMRTYHVGGAGVVDSGTLEDLADLLEREAGR